ncbi:MAG: Gfo/Idh/MocA family oxidoreductase [Planctomycetes bacterium]|nr:Gfo/Idh/MocA family oxidoreductase [Planctomycetota bacterium]
MSMRWALAGTGSRGIGMFARPLATEDVFKGHAEIVALFDVSPTRMDVCRRSINMPDLPVFTDYDRMLGEADPDGVIVCTRDCTHAEYIVKALQKGKDAVSEKPLCTTAEQARAILAADAASDGRVLVTHNMRYGPAVAAMKKAVDEGVVGDVLFMEFREMLDRRHGADYFRRWHGRKKNSGGLLIHKASHHFDVLNYMLDGAKPAFISARGGLNLYGAGGPYRSTRCRGCPHASECPFFADMAKDENTVRLYFDAEEDSGYIRDGCVFAADIDIEDTVAAGYEYDNGVRVSYSLCAYASWEGFELTIQGTGGRLELLSRVRAWGHGSFAVHGLEKTGASLVLFSHADGYVELPVDAAEGGHGGADPKLRYDFFCRDRSEPRTPQMASLEEGAQAVLIGAAANRSIAAGGAPVDIQALLSPGK